MHLSLKHTLAGLFLGLAGVTAIQGVTTSVELFRISKGFAEVADRLLPSVTAVSDLHDAVDQIRHRQTRLTLAPSSDIARLSVLELNEAEAVLLKARARFATSKPAPDIQVAFSRFDEAWAAYVQASAPLRDLVIAGRGAEAKQLLLSPQLRRLNVEAGTLLDKVVDLTTESAAREVSADVDIARRATITAGVAVVAAIVFALLASVLCYLRVVRPVETVTRVMRQLAAGKSDLDLPATDPRNEIGAMMAALRVFRDSLVRMRAAEAARDHTQLLVENIAATAPDGIIGIDHRGIVTFWNAAAERLLGYPSAAVIGQSAATIAPHWVNLTLDQRLSQLRRMAGQTVEAELVRRDGIQLPAELSFGHWTQDGNDMFCTILRDVSARKAHEEALHTLARVDPLTGLPNRSELSTGIAAGLATGRPLAVLVADLDRFKQVNDLMGHQAGDAVLTVAAARMQACVGPHDTITRIGGDEFVIFVADATDRSRATDIAAAIIASLSQPFLIDGQTIHLGGSVGVAFAPDHATAVDDLISCADTALYAAKSDGRDCFRVFTAAMRQAAAAENACRQELRRAVGNGEFVLHYQPQRRLSDGALIGAEALIRWQHPEHGLLAPSSFLSVLENSPHAAEVGYWVIRTACRQAAIWRHQGLPGFRVGVNLSGSLFRGGELADRVEAILAETGLPGAALEVEITETIILNHDEALLEPLRRLKAAGVGIAFDDYGTGYASLSLLKRFPLTRLKIDRSFVRDMLSSPADSAIISAVRHLGRKLGLRVTAEGIETEQQWARLARKGCEEGQGYLFGKPMPAEALTALLREGEHIAAEAARSAA